MLSEDIHGNELYISEKLGFGINFDVVLRKFKVLGTDVSMYTINGLIDSLIVSDLLENLLKINEDYESKGSSRLLEIFENKLVHMQVEKTTEMDKLVLNVMSGCMVILVNGYTEGIIIDTRSYPSRTPEESQNEPTVRGSNDGFVENIIVNTALVRRRIKHPKLRYEMLKVGEISQLDVVLCYLDNKADKEVLNEIKYKLSNTTVKEFTMGNQALQEVLFPKKINPLPYSKITERPDVFAAELTKGYIGILTDNSPNGLIVPINLIDMLGNIEHHQISPYTATLFKIVNLTLILIVLIVIPYWYYLAMNPEAIPKSVEYLKIPEEYKVPVLAQILFIMTCFMTISIALFTTPKIHRTALILATTIVISGAGIESKLLAPSIVLSVLIAYLFAKTMFVNELHYAFLSFTIVQIISIYFFGLYGLLGTLMILFLFLATRKAFGRHYLYPLIPLNIKKLVNYIFRFRKSN